MAKIAIIYASGLGRTKKMAETIAEGAKTIEGVEVVLKDAYDAKIPEDIEGASAILLGGSTYNGKLNRAMDPVLEKLASVDLKGKVGLAFGSYGWHDVGVPTLIEKMKSFGMNVIEPGLSVVQVPDAKALERCFHLGRTVAKGVTN
ncbi:MAG: flavodoxin domain-containing protein [Methanothrix sp.]|uniref:flavodoxin domain-containing protein n=1 Tax=Methanothrix sp. TaxID=90426 RepID=UPI0032AECF10|nr:flavodoxin domain-containing protein [Methanothrix sp.]